MMKQVVSSIIVGGWLLIGGGSGPVGAFPVTAVNEKQGGNDDIKGIFEQLLNKDFSGVMLGLPKFTSDLEGNQEVNDVLEINWNGGCLPPGCIAQGEDGQIVQNNYNFPGGASTELALIKFEDADGGFPFGHISDQLALWQDFNLRGPTHYAMTFTSDCDAPRAPSPQTLQIPTCDSAAPPPPPPSVPEPSALALIIIGLVGYAWRQRKK